MPLKLHLVLDQNEFLIEDGDAKFAEVLPLVHEWLQSINDPLAQQRLDALTAKLRAQSGALKATVDAHQSGG